MQPGDIMEFRMKHNLTGSELAVLLGCHKSQICRWETKHQKIPRWVGNYFRLIELTGKPVREVLRSIQESARMPQDRRSAVNP